MQKQATRQFKLTAVIDGSTYIGSIAVDGGVGKTNFIQFVNADGTVLSAYDWNNAGPKFRLKIVDTATGLEQVPTDLYMTYEGKKITWDSNGLSNNTGLVGVLKKTTKNVMINGANTQVPYIQFVNNVASGTNLDNDSFFLSGYITINGQSVYVQTPEQQIQVVVTGSGSPYRLEVTGNDIMKGATTTTLTATLYGEGGAVTSGVSYEWFKNDMSTNAPGTRTQKTLSVSADNVDGTTVFICKATYSDATFYGSRQVMDLNDPYWVDITVTGVAQEGYISKNDTNVAITPRLKDTKGAAVTGKTVTYEWHLVNGAGGAIDLTGKIGTGGVITLGSQGYTFVKDTCSGSMSGYVTATIS